MFLRGRVHVCNVQDPRFYPHTTVLIIFILSRDLLGNEWRICRWSICYCHVLAYKTFSRIQNSGISTKLLEHSSTTHVLQMLHPLHLTKINQVAVARWAS